jgi:hypothetical protein
MKIARFEQKLQSNTRYANILFSDEFIKEAVEKLCALIREKYKDISISPEFHLHLIKYEHDNFITVNGTFCIGDGDYITRSVAMPLPELSWATLAVGEQPDFCIKVKPV